MLSGFHTTVFNDGGKRIYHNCIGFPQFRCLFLNQLLLIQPVECQLNDILNSSFYHIRFKRLHNNIRSAQIKSFHFVFRGILRSNNNHREFIQKMFSGQLFHYLISIHHRHNQIQQNDYNAGMILSCKNHSLFSILSL